MTIRYSSRLWLLFSSCLVLASCSSPNSEAPGGSGAAPSSGGAGAGGTSSTGATSGGGSGGRITGGTLEAGAGGVGAGAGAGGSGAGSGGAAAGSGGTGSGGTECPPFAIPSAAELVANPKLPDPFTFMDGSKVETKADWVCRRQEISQLAQAFIYGRKPPDPESVEATYSGGTLDITVTDGGKSLEFSVEITGAGSGEGSPAVMDFGGGLAVSGAKTIAFGSVSMELAASSFSQGRDAPSGKFYELYPDYQDTGSLMAWAWGASRIIDALE